MQYVLRLALVCALAATACLGSTAPAPAAVPPADPALLVPIDAFVSAIVHDAPGRMAAAFGPTSTILDDLPPNTYAGPTAYAQWYASFVATNRAQQLVLTYLDHGSPTYAHVVGDRAYVVVPADFTYTLAGKPYAESAAWTFSLVKLDGSWKIASWAWSLLTSTAE